MNMETQEPAEPKPESEAASSKFFSDFETAIVRCLRSAKGGSGFAAANAVVHLKKAWDLRDLDSQMAAFRAITAEEEAATAILLLLRERRYEGAKKSDLHDHRVKQALYPFLREVWAVLRPAREILKPVVHVIKMNGKEAVDINYNIPGSEMVCRSVPPLGLILLPDSIQGLTPEEVVAIPKNLTEMKISISEPSSAKECETDEELRKRTVNLAEMLKVRLSAKATANGYREIRRQLQEEANKRNRLLYASSKGWPGPVKDIEAVLRARKGRSFILLTIYCLIFPHKEVATLVEQVLASFNELLDSSLFMPRACSQEAEAGDG